MSHVCCSNVWREYMPKGKVVKEKGWLLLQIGQPSLFQNRVFRVFQKSSHFSLSLAFFHVNFLKRWVLILGKWQRLLGRKQDWELQIFWASFAILLSISIATLSTSRFDCCWLWWDLAIMEKLAEAVHKEDFVSNLRIIKA